MTKARRGARALAILHLGAERLVVDEPPGVPLAPGRGESARLPDLVQDQAQLPDDAPCRTTHRLRE